MLNGDNFRVLSGEAAVVLFMQWYWSQFGQARGYSFEPVLPVRSTRRRYPWDAK